MLLGSGPAAEGTIPLSHLRTGRADGEASDDGTLAH